ncbi:MAG: ribonuclease III [Rhodospirillales bacterium]|nr:ribonuclease III [Rhodospirillales bacterium]
MTATHAAGAGERLWQAEALLGHRFAQPELLAEALTHRSVLGEGPQRAARARLSNERLEFLGDRVLGLLVAEWLAERFPAEAEGALGRRLAHLVAAPTLAAIARDNQVSELLAVAEGEARAGVRARDNVLADALEALLGALFLDGGLDVARRAVRRLWAGAIAVHAAPPKDAKTALQEWAQARGLGLPVYTLTASTGPAHAPLFRVRARAGQTEAEGQGTTRRGAEQDAATQLLERLAT